MSEVARALPLRQALKRVLRDLPEFYLGGMDRWLLRVHRPEELEGRAVCMGGRKVESWPCAEWLAAEGRLKEHDWRLVWASPRG